MAKKDGFAPNAENKFRLCDRPKLLIVEDTCLHACMQALANDETVATILIGN